MEPTIVNQADWEKARLELLAAEKEFTKKRDELTAKVRDLPWVQLDKDYKVNTNDGAKTLSELFADKSQLLVYHFMYGADWQAGCKSCSFWADNFDGIDVHLAQRDVAFWAVSTAPLATLNAFKERMGWRFNWASSEGSDFNFDFGVSFPEGQAQGTYNYRVTKVMAELPGISVFAQKDGAVYHTYSTYSRGLDMFNGAYHFLDIVPKGRDEAGFGSSMEWLKLKDLY